jgi:hypothetical protein
MQIDVTDDLNVALKMHLAPSYSWHGGMETSNCILFAPARAAIFGAWCDLVETNTAPTNVDDCRPNAGAGTSDPSPTSLFVQACIVYVVLKLTAVQWVVRAPANQIVLLIASPAPWAMASMLVHRVRNYGHGHAAALLALVADRLRDDCHSQESALHLAHVWHY